MPLTDMAPIFSSKEITSGTRWSIPIPNQNINRCPGGQGANPYNVAQHVNGSYLVNMQHILRIPQVNTSESIFPTQGVTEICRL